MSYRKVCSICHAPFEGWGHNAAPFPGRCCEECNAVAVTPIRATMAQLTDALRANKERAA